MDIDTTLLFRSNDSPSPKAVVNGKRVRSLCEDLARELQAIVPDGLQRDTAILRLREVCNLALDSIVNDGQLTVQDSFKSWLIDQCGVIWREDVVVTELHVTGIQYADIRKYMGRDYFDCNHLVEDLKKGFQGTLHFGSPIKVYTHRAADLPKPFLKSEPGKEYPIEWPTHIFPSL